MKEFISAVHIMDIEITEIEESGREGVFSVSAYEDPPRHYKQLRVFGSRRKRWEKLIESGEKTTFEIDTCIQFWLERTLEITQFPLETRLNSFNFLSNSSAKHTCLLYTSPSPRD